MPYYDKQKARWIGQVKQNNQKFRKFFNSEKEALKWELQLVDQKEQLNEPVAQSLTSSISLLEFFTRYLEFAEIKFSRKTFKEKQAVFRNLLKSVPPNVQVKDVSRGSILKHLQEQATKRSGYAANKDRKNLISAWNWGGKYIDYFPPGNPCFVDRFPEKRQHRYVPPEKDFWAVLAIAETPQDKAMLLAYLHLGARRNEIFQLRWEDVDFIKKQIRLYTRKRKDGSLEYDHLPLTKDLLKIFENQRKASVGEYVFPNPDTGIPYFERGKWMRRLCAAAEVRPFGLHSIRHLTASILVQEDVSLIDVQTILRHKKLSTTERYVHRLKSVRASLQIMDGRNVSPTVGPVQTKLRLVGNE